MRTYGVQALAAFAAAVVSISAALAPRPPFRPNILLITVDTMRADRLGAYGDATARTANMDALAREGLVFDNAACPMPLTRPSHASILTSQYPRDHGVMNNRIALPPGALTLPQVLTRAGYRAAGFVSAKLLARDSGMTDGMDPFEAPRSVPMWDADRVVPRARQWIEKVSSGRAPFFVWLHLFDPHIPYAPPEAWRPAGPLAEELPEVAWEDLTAMAGRNAGALSREVLERAEGLYAGEIAFTDHWLGELLGAMRRQGLLDSTVIVLTADHGECFENGIYFEHSECMYDGAIRVPLIIRYPARIAPGRRGEQVQNLDIAPTILALAGIPAPQEFQGRSLLVVMGPGEGEAFLQHPLYQQDTTENRRRMLEQIRTVAGQPVRPLLSGRDEVGLRTPGWKYFVAGSDRELYDLQADPRESANLAAANGERAAQLDARVREWVRAHPMRIVDDSKINEELRETLRSLGYVQ